MRTSERIVVRAFGGPEVLELEHGAPIPDPGPGQVRVAVDAAGVGFTDTATRRGTNPGYRGGLPVTPGFDVVGTVDALGPGATDVSVGDRVADIPGTGGYATYLVRPADCLVRITPALDPAIAVCVPLIWTTAWQLLTRVRLVPRGSWVLVVGASGGVGTAMLTLAHHLGLRVIGTSSAARRPAVEAFGATAFDYRDPDLVRRVTEASGGGVAAAFDAIGGRSAERAYACVRPGGLFVGYGAQHLMSGRGSLLGTARDAARVAVLWNRPRALGGRGIASRLYTIERQRAKHPNHYIDDVQCLCDKLADGTLPPPALDRIALSGVRAAHAALDAGANDRKFVIDMTRAVSA